MESKYTVVAKKSKRIIRQRYYWIVKSNANGQTILKSEMLTNGTYCRNYAEEYAIYTNAIFKCEY